MHMHSTRKALARTLNARRVSFPPWRSFLNVGLLRPRTFWSMGSSALIVLDNGLLLTTQTSALPRQYPALKKVVCDEIRFARLRPSMGLLPLSESSGNVMTCRSTAGVSRNGRDTKHD
jgi:hypothetical protein